MIRKLLFLALTTLLYCSVNGQTVISNPNDCIQDYTIEAKTIAGNNQRVDDILISWDFKELSKLENVELSFQVQPLNSCWKKLDGKIRSSLKTYKIRNFIENTSGSQKLEFNNLNCKCLKWKAIIIDLRTNCQIETEWQFTSFL
ncbi:hypothetical protein [Psychroserpens jangbogonensis]|uniref:hypothetical protein n=1 Tax=Psychroserpens jangbogonensis TaxID=1484460 RepID=UPI00053CF1E1|nr:hypothetical protein [Psychroserpens jangbogonensis]